MLDTFLHLLIDTLASALGIPHEAALIVEIVALFSLVIFLLLLDRIRDMLRRHLRSCRRRIDQRENLVGTWLERIEKSGLHYYTVVDFRFDKHENVYVIAGTAYDERLQRHATFASSLLSELTSNRVLEFLFLGAYVRTGRAVKGYCIWNINPGLRDGSGYIVDFELDEEEGVMRQTLRLSFSITLLTPARLKGILGKATIDDETDRQTLLLHEQYANS